jgi:hypothetical protein
MDSTATEAHNGWEARLDVAKMVADAERGYVDDSSVARPPGRHAPDKEIARESAENAHARADMRIRQGSLGRSAGRPRRAEGGRKPSRSRCSLVHMVQTPEHRTSADPARALWPVLARRHRRLEREAPVGRSTL